MAKPLKSSKRLLLLRGRLAWLLLALSLFAAPTTAIATEFKCDIPALTTFLFGDQDIVWLGKVERVQTSLIGFGSRRHGDYWVKPLSPVKGALPKKASHHHWTGSWDDVEGYTGEPEIGELKLVGGTRGAYSAYPAPCLDGREDAGPPPGPQRDGHERVEQARQARLAGDFLQAWGLIRRAFADLDATAAGQPEHERDARFAEVFLERYLIEKMDGAGGQCEDDIRFADLFVRKAAADDPRTAALRAQIEPIMTAEKCKRFP